MRIRIHKRTQRYTYNLTLSLSPCLSLSLSLFLSTPLGANFPPLDANFTLSLVILCPSVKLVVFFVDHDQSQILKSNVPLRESMRADRDIHFTRSHPLECLGLLFAGLTPMQYRVASNRAECG